MNWMGLVGGVVAGVVLGGVVFGGLWWTVRRMADARRPALLMTASLLTRLGVAALVFVIAARSGLEAVVGGLAGMVAVRSVMARSITSDTTPLVGTDPRSDAVAQQGR